MKLSELFPPDPGRVYPDVTVVRVLSPPGSLSLFFCLEYGTGFELGRPENALEVADREVRARKMTARQRDILADLLDGGLGQAAQLRAARQSGSKGALEQEGAEIPRRTGDGESVSEIISTWTASP